MSGLRFEPGNTVERIADAGMRAMKAAADAEGVELGDSIIFATLAEPPDGEQNAAVHPNLTSDEEPTPESVLAFACAVVQQYAQAAGYPLDWTLRVGFDATYLRRALRDVDEDR